MPRKSSGETFVWNTVKEKRLLEKLDDFYSSNPGRQPGKQIYDLWAKEFNIEFASPLRGLRHKELQYNVFEKTHAAGAYGYGSVTMGDGSTPSVDYEFKYANSETHPCLDEDLTPIACGRQADTRQGPDVAGPS
ncbi:hypothetical protein TIFTF001_032915 [Ficus carica]|uniref:Uncharacterized protein n=1 Tax=Ficus carica TaxID=3494 RepID=A0AA88E123_FICCA|nr:hypothetical protein TIFTF001_032915 [Ficus carica]